MQKKCQQAKTEMVKMGREDKTVRKGMSSLVQLRQVEVQWYIYQEANEGVGNRITTRV